MKVWLITVGEPLPIDEENNPRLLRAGVLAKYLVKHGHEVLWWSSSFDHYKKRQRVSEDTSANWEGGEIRMLKSIGYKSNVSFRRFIEHAGVARKFKKQASAYPKPDVILVSLPTIELAAESVAFAKRNEVPVLVDIRDLWPDLLVDVFPEHIRWLGRLLLFPLIRRATYALRECTGIVGISDRYLNWGLKYANRGMCVADAMIPLGYTPPTSSVVNIESAHIRLSSMGVDKNKIIIWYIGSFGRQYDLAPVIESAAMLNQRGNLGVQFVISGNGEMDLTLAGYG